MATIYTHAFVGLGLGAIFARRRTPALFWCMAVVLPVVPDLDVFTNVTYGSVWGHRGVTHTLMFALWLAFFAATLTYRYFKARLWQLTAFFFAVIASHGLLDAFTTGGYGVPFFWPASDARFGPWGPIHIQDIGFEWPDPRTSAALQTELLFVWLPLTVLVAGIWIVRWKRSSMSIGSAIQSDRRTEPSPVPRIE